MASGHRLEYPQTTRLRFPGTHKLSAEHLTVHNVSDTKVSRWGWSRVTFQSSDLDSMPWLGWLFAYTFALFFFSMSRCLALTALLGMYGSSSDNTVVSRALVLSLGFLEDVVCATHFAAALWLFDTVRRLLTKHPWTAPVMASRRAGVMTTFVVSWILCIITIAPPVADLLLVV